MFFGVILPLATILIELVYRMCSQEIFDPIPTPWHLALALAVPVGNLAAWVALGRAAPRHFSPWLPVVGLLNGLAIAGGVYFSLVFLPLLPLAVIAIAFMGLGLLPCSPLFGCIAAMRACARLRAWSAPTGRSMPGIIPGVLLGFFVVACLVAPGVLTRRGFEMATSTNPETQKEGVRFLRRFGDQQQLLRLCYGQRRQVGSPWDGVTSPARVDEDEAQKVFYRVTGKRFDSFPAPVGRADRWSADPNDPDWALRGLEAIGTTLPGLTASSSTINGWVNADAATAYFEWTMVFSNARAFPQEGRTHIALPRGGCVTRLTLWINGEEREAAWGGKAQVRAAYEEVVRVQRRDPVLVTHAGPDRVMMQCFPVPPNGTMKVRVGITAPLHLASADSGEVELPRLLDRNFSISHLTPHMARIESRAPLSAPGTGLRPESRNAGVLSGGIAEPRLAGRVKLSVPRDPGVTTVWFDDSFDKTGTVVQRLEPRAVPPPSRLVLAIDASADMAAAQIAVADALAALPAGIKVTALVGTDAGVTEVSGNLADVAGSLRKVQCVGGQDGVPLLDRAMKVAGNDAGTVLLWVHGAQPVELDALERFTEKLTSTGGILSLQVNPGRNVVLESLARTLRVEQIEPGSDLRDALRNTFASWAAERHEFRAVRQRLPQRPSEGPGVKRGDVQVVRLWALDEVLRQCSCTGPAARGDAIRFAVAHQIVSPVSGAVVLENQAQYDAAGLTPVAAVPLPAPVWMALLTLPLVWLAWKKARRAGAA
ncbi:MAG TPA: VIT domain-containing protein [Tepidisphaeraceae bacterium]|nr:VIT domain-containing protein [Tepidisphaeraceae bacterium]